MATKPKKESGDAGLLARYEHHAKMASKHRAHADLIEARLRTHGKRISHYPADHYSSSPKPKPKIVSLH